MYREKSSLAGKTLTIKTGQLAGEDFTVEDWWQNVYGGESWMAKGAQPPAVISYSARVLLDKLPVDDDVLYGKIKDVGFLVHKSELGG